MAMHLAVSHAWACFMFGVSVAAAAAPPLSSETSAPTQTQGCVAPRILSSLYGYAACIGSASGTSPDELRSRGCVVLADDTTNVVSASRLHLKCGRIPPWQDGMPLTFSHPIVASSLDATDFEVTLSNGSVVTPVCTVLTPANEGNEGHTPLLMGGFGDGLRGSVHPVSVRVVGSLRVELQDGTHADVQGISYANSLDMTYVGSSVRLVRARVAPFSKVGESLFPFPWGRYPNHCRTVFPSTTHVIKTMWSGGVSLDGLTSLQPASAVASRLFAIRDAAGLQLPPSALLGLADLGRDATAAAGKAYVQDGDNYVDVCLQLNASVAATLVGGVINASCSGPLGTQLYPPKGRYPCQPGHGVEIEASEVAVSAEACSSQSIVV